MRILKHVILGLLNRSPMSGCDITNDPEMVGKMPGLYLNKSIPKERK